MGELSVEPYPVTHFRWLYGLLASRTLHSVSTPVVGEEVYNTLRTTYTTTTTTTNTNTTTTTRHTCTHTHTHVYVHRHAYTSLLITIIVIIIADSQP